MSNYKTPLRYPGGKQKLTPFIIDILTENGIDGQYVEPFAGGAGVGIELLLSRRVNHIHLNDSNFGIYSFWYSILNYAEEFCKLIQSASMTIDEWRRQKEISKSIDQSRILEIGFSFFFLNRCNRSGVISGGVIGGNDQSGNYKMDARFSRNDLIRRIELISLFKKQITISNFDAEEYIKNYIPRLPKNCLIYLDPPYYEKGSDLYLNHYKKSDHEHLSHIIQKEISRNWVLSYDGSPAILEFYKNRRHFIYDLQYCAARSYKGKEVFIFCDSIRLPKNCSLKFIDLGLKTFAQP